MKRLLVIILIIAAIGVYTYDAFLLVKPSVTSKSLKHKQRDMEASLENLIARSKPVRFQKSDRNPFLPHVVKQSAPRQNTVIAAMPKATVAAPSITINGIMWDPQSPLAMIVLPDGSSAAVKQGQTIGDITVKKIEKERICVAYQNKTFWIAR